MRSHLRKLLAFATIQAALFAVVHLVADPPATTPPAAGATLTSEARLRQSLSEQLFRAWLADPDTVRRADEHGAADKTLKRAFSTFNSDEDGYLMSIVEKDHRLRHAPGPRLILIGGSNLAFGMDSRIMEERYGVAPVNLGLHEMLRAGYLLRHTADHVRQGDVVVYCFEYGTLLSGGEPANVDLQERLCGALPDMRAYFAESRTSPGDVARSSWKNYADRQALADFAAQTRDIAERFRHAAKRLPGRLWHRGFESEATLRGRFDEKFSEVSNGLVAEYVQWSRAKDVYARSGFNEYGDIIGHYGRTSNRAIEPNRMPPLNEEQRRAVIRSFDELNRYTAVFRERGAEVLFAFPPLCSDQPNAGEDFETLVADHCDAPILFPIAAARTRLTEHYDTAYHLNWQGICRRMEVWTTALDRHLRPRVALSPAAHVAVRDRTIRPTILAADPAPATTVH